MRILDLFCGAGGAAMGYHRAGFEVVGVDLNPMKRFPFEFHQGNALDYISEHAHEFDAIHASPPCQGYSAMSACRPGLSDEYPRLIDPVRDLLDQTGLPYVMENVMPAPLRPDLILCGHMFDLALYRHRKFESNIPLEQPDHPPHLIPASKAGHWKPGTIMSISGHVSPIKLAREAMGIDWMTRDQLAEAIPPAYTEHVGHQLLAHLLNRAAA